MALWGDSEKDAEWLMDSEDFGEVRLTVAPRTDEPVFVGIAATDEVSQYLRGVVHTSVTDVDSWPFETSYAERAVAGDRGPEPPGKQAIWPHPPRAPAPRRSSGTSRTATGPSSS